MNITQPIKKLLPLAVLLASFSFVSCNNNDGNVQTNASPSGGSIPMPAELNFDRIESNQQQQQQNGKCPPKFKAVIQQSGIVTIEDPQGQQVVQGKMSDNDLARIATTANEVVSTGVEEEVACDDSANNTGGMPFTADQVSVTDKQQQTSVVAAKQGGKSCDFSKSKKGKDLQQQVNTIVQQTCGGHLPPPSPTPNPSASPSPNPTPVGTPEPSPSPGTSPSPSPSASPSPSPGTGGTDTTSNAECLAALNQLSGRFTAAQSCSSDVQCNYINEMGVIPRTETSVFVTEFECGDATPRLTVANGTFFEDNFNDLAGALSDVLVQCDLRLDTDFACNSRGGFVTSKPPVCSSGVCTKGR